jgi:hypothetical protein
MRSTELSFAKCMKGRPMAISKRIICFFKGHIWGPGRIFDPTGYIHAEHDCLRCGVTHGAIAGDLGVDFFKNPSGL